MTALLDARGVTVTYGGVHANNNVDLAVDEGQFVGLIGANGAGKTTFVDAITGFAPISAGNVSFAGHDITKDAPEQRARRGLVRTFQALELFDDLTVWDNLLVACEPTSPWSLPSDLVRRGQRKEVKERASWALETVGLAHLADRLPEDLSHGQRKIVGVARALAAKPRLVLLDEPAAGLDAAESLELAKTLRGLLDQGISVFLIDHDMGLVLSVCDQIYVLDFGKIVASGNPASIRRDPAVIAAYLGDGAANDGGELGTSLIELESLWTGYDGVPVVRDITMNINEGEIVGLLGPNGAGKTTTLLTISGVIKPLRGDLQVLGGDVPRFPHTLARRGVAHVTESRNLFYDLTVNENMRLALRGSRADRKAALATALEMFPALEPLQDRRAALLSGGEQQMLACARALVSRPKVLLLDEMSLGLAPIIVERLLKTVREMADQTGAAVVLVEQHVHLALRIVDRAYVMSHGNIAHQGTAEELERDRDVLESSYLGDIALDETEAQPTVNGQGQGAG